MTNVGSNFSMFLLEFLSLGKKKKRKKKNHSSEAITIYVASKKQETKP